MKMKLLFISLILTMAVSKSNAGCFNDGGANATMLTLVTTTLPPFATTALLTGCSEVDPQMVEREATMFVEEGKIFVPSFLGTYAEQHQMDIRTAAQDVLINGVK